MDALTHLPKTQAQLARRLKVRGAQSIKILAAQLQLTTMGVRQHLVQLQDKGYAKHAQTNLFETLERSILAYLRLQHVQHLRRGAVRLAHLTGGGAYS